ncbi:aldehyde dehydrogenase [Novosphingobium sp. KCTC 2891]|uniref:aldehyde dehydrogenase n=1 Tax=Novosphingobium sp. KCTC 2891 TaxID=2989730 RepID=UPI002223C310|nr:aldehyde dehydrogenase [Novosphingobium sp. KCTC 2891]MCW1385010.1 aldehyde dehydrogenase [Novosphingobium sp. KCTC 2891]
MTIKHPDRFYIDGAWAAPSAATTFRVITPSTEELFVEVAEAQEADVLQAVAAARRAFDAGGWTGLSHARRAEYLRALGDTLAARSAEVAHDWVSEMGITLPAAQAVSQWSSHVYQYYAGMADTFAFEERQSLASGNIGLMVREPVGVVAAIIPWNAPPLLIAYKLAPALLAGCAVILKASPEAPSAAYAVAEAAESIGLPKGVLNVLTADRAVSELLVRHPGVDKVTFTGSSAAGKRIASLCGERIARVTLELGGKSAAIVMDDADLGSVVQAMTGNTCMMTGQVCASLTRVIVSRSRHDELVDGLAAAYAQVKVGDPFAEDTQMGPLAMSRQRDRVEHYIETGKAQGARLATGGGRPSHLNRGFYVEPTVFGNVDNASTIAREEIFGPVVSVIPVDDEQQAIAVANDSDFGLSGTVFTDDADKAYHVARQVRTGTISQNGAAAEFFDIAFGGFKQSGIGREGGREGLLPFLETKAVVLNGLPAHLAGAD